MLWGSWRVGSFRFGVPCYAVLHLDFMSAVMEPRRQLHADSGFTGLRVVGW